jgi:hypothetical protein
MTKGVNHKRDASTADLHCACTAPALAGEVGRTPRTASEDRGGKSGPGPAEQDGILKGAFIMAASGSQKPTTSGQVAPENRSVRPGEDSGGAAPPPASSPGAGPHPPRQPAATAADRAAANALGREGGRPDPLGDEDEDDLDELDLPDEVDGDEDLDPVVEDGNAVPSTLSIAVPNGEPWLLQLLEAVVAHDDAARTLICWLGHRGDGRVAAVRDLASVRLVLPEPGGSWATGARYPMGCGRWWAATRSAQGVAAGVFPGTPFYNTLVALGAKHRVAFWLPVPEQTAETLRAAFRRCRNELLLSLFGTSLRQLRDRRAVLTSARMDRVTNAVERWGQAAVPWLRELRANDPPRFKSVMGDLRSSAAFARWLTPP